MSLDKLPELRDMIPLIVGDVYSYMGTTYLAPQDTSTAAKVPDHGLVRCGFRLYEVLGWAPARDAMEVRPFKATLNAQELQRLATRRSDAKGEAA